MPKYNRNGWLDAVTDEIRFKPDRKAVRDELEAHMIDKEETLRDAGLPADTASQRTIEAMGDPVEVGKAMNRVHKPILGYIWLASKLAVLLLLMVFIFSALSFDFSELLSRYPLRIEHINPWSGSYEAGTVDYSAKKLKISGYTIAVTDAKLYLVDGKYIISADVKVTNARPWSAPPLFMGGLTSDDGSDVDTVVYFKNSDTCSGDIFRADVLSEFRYWNSWYFNISITVDSPDSPVNLVYPYNSGLVITLYPKEAV